VLHTDKHEKLTEPFILLRLNPLGQRKLPIVISLSRMLCFGRVCASPCALNVSAALQGAYRPPKIFDWAACGPRVGHSRSRRIVTLYVMGKRKLVLHEKSLLDE